MDLLSQVDLDAEWIKWREYLTKPLTEEELEAMNEENEENPDPSEYCPICGAKPGTPGDLCSALLREPPLPYMNMNDLSWFGQFADILRAGPYPIFQRRFLPLDCNESPQPEYPALWHPWGRYSIFSRLRQTFDLPLPDAAPSTIPYTWYDGKTIAPYKGTYATYGVVCFLYGGSFYEWDPKSNAIKELGHPSRTNFYLAFEQPPQRDETSHPNRGERKKQRVKKKKKWDLNLRAPVVMVKTMVLNDMPAFGRLPLELVDEILFFLKPLHFLFDSDFDVKVADNLGRRHGLGSFIRSAKRFVDIGRRHLYPSPWLKGWYQWEDLTDEVLFLRSIKQNPHLRSLVKYFTYDLEIGLHGGLESLSGILDESHHIESLSLQGLTSISCFYIMYSLKVFPRISCLKLHGIPKGRRFSISIILRYLARFTALRELELRRVQFSPTFRKEVSNKKHYWHYWFQKPEFKLQTLAIYDSGVGPDFVPILETSLSNLKTLVWEDVECSCYETVHILTDLTRDSP
ncbi:hypothetical protein BT69DRAFT_1282255, partial [Atractiella rhizophila]